MDTGQIVNNSSQARHSTQKKREKSPDRDSTFAEEKRADRAIFLPEIDAAKCIGCELCVKACPNGALAMVNEVAVVANPDACDYASVCQEICPTQAISLTYELVF